MAILKNSWFQSLCIVLACFFLYLPFDVPTVGNASDNSWYVPTGLSILKEGNIELSEYVPAREKTYGITWIRGRPYNLFPLGTSLVSLPMVFVGERIYSDRTTEEQFFLIASASAKVLAALTAGLFFLTCLRLTRSRKLSFLLTFLLAFATSQFSTHGGGLWSHNTSSFLLTLALLLLTGPENWIFAAAAPLALGYIARPTLAIHIILITVYVFFLYRKQFLWFALVGGGIAVLFFLFSYQTYGQILPPYYSGSRLGFEHFPEALLGNVISPNRGLFVFTPVFLASIWGIVLAFRGRTGKNGFYRLLSVMVVVQWIVISLFPHWWAGYSVGPRFFCDVLSPLVLLMIPALRQWGSLERAKKLTAYVLFCIALLWSLFVQYRSAVHLEVYQWNQSPVSVALDPSRIWDWNDLQILRSETPPLLLKRIPNPDMILSIYRENQQIVQITGRDVPRISNTTIFIRGNEYAAVLLSDLLKDYGIEGQTIRFESEKKELVLSIQQTVQEQLVVYFLRNGAGRLYSNESGKNRLPGRLQRITVQP